MTGTILLLIAGVAFLVGMAIGVGVVEAGTRQRERRVAEQRRELAELADAVRRRRRQALPPSHGFVIDQDVVGHGDITRAS